MTLARRSDSGQYSCEVINEQGIDIAHTRVVVKGTLLDVLCHMNLSEEKGKSLGRIVCIGKIAASILLKQFINSNDRCHTTDAP